ncbi:MAG: potassium channel family protein [Cetobacterium sp.]
MNSNKNNNTMIFYGTLYIGLIFLFGFIYFGIGKGNFKLPTDEDYNFITFMYFSSITMTTLGYGDILPITSLSRGLASLQTILGIVIIGFFLNSVASKQAKDLENLEEARKLPIRIAIYNDIRLLILRMTSIWIEAYNASVPGKELDSIEELLSKETFDKIRVFLDIRSEAPVAPKRSWIVHLENDRDEILERGNRILDKYGIFLDYNIYGIINTLLNESTIFSILNMIGVISSVDR